MASKGSGAALLQSLMRCTRDMNISHAQVLNLLLFGLRKRLPQPELLAFLRVDEHLVDIGDDLVDYEDDVLENCFNIYRGALECPRSSVGCCCALVWSARE